MTSGQWGGALAISLLGLVAASCVDHESNAHRFCSELTDLLDERHDDEVLTTETTRDRADEVAEHMRYAEDGTRPVREAGRAMLIAYDDFGELADDDRSAAELDEAASEIRRARAEVRDACASVGDDDE